MTLTIGIAIPCHNAHFHFLRSLLENIASSNVKPNQIAISCSSWNHNKTEYIEYAGIPVHIWYSSEKLNASQNRNRAASLLNTNLISFIDADDVMHPRRIEFLLQAFETRPDISAVYHDYKFENVSMREQPFWEEPIAIPISQKIVKDPNPNAHGAVVEGRSDYGFHHAHVTVRSTVFSIFKFNEDWKYNRIEDSVYAVTLVTNDVPCLYLKNKLSRYSFNN